MYRVNDYNLERVAPPGDQIVTLAEAKTQLELDGVDHRDEYLTRLIEAASDHWEDETRYILRSGSFLFTRLNSSGFYGCDYPLPVYPVASVESVTAKDQTTQARPDEVIDPATWFLAYPRSTRSFIRFSTLPTLKTGFALEIALTAGVPNPLDYREDVKQAVLLLLASWFTSRSDTVPGNADRYEIPHGFQMIANKYNKGDAYTVYS